MGGSWWSSDGWSEQEWQSWKRENNDWEPYRQMNDSGSGEAAALTGDSHNETVGRRPQFSSEAHGDEDLSLAAPEHFQWQSWDLEKNEWADRADRLVDDRTVHWE